MNLNAKESSEPPQTKAPHPVVYGCARFAALYVFAAVTSLAAFKVFHSWPFNDPPFFFTWPYIWIIFILRPFPVPFFWDGIAALAVFLVLQLPVVWGLRPGNKWYRNAAILIALYVQIFIATLLLAIGA